MSKRIKIKTKQPWVGYPGSFAQHTYAEALDHGFLLWDIDKADDFKVKFVELPNPKPYVTIDWMGSTSKTVAAAKQYPVGSRFRIKSKESLAQKEVEALTQELQHSLSASEVTFKDEHRIDKAVLTAGASTLVKEDLRNPEVLLKLVKDFHKGARVTQAEWEAVKESVARYLSQTLNSDDDAARNIKWTLRYLAFDNVFAYGKGNSINFDQLPGIVGIFGPNRAGKSSVVGAIMYSLFNASDRGNVKNLHVVNVRHPYCYTKAIIDVSGTGYVIERQTTKHENKWGQVNAITSLNVFRMRDDGEMEDLGGEERKDTERVIKRIIGSGEDALLTGVAAQDDIKQYINLGSARRRQSLSRFLDLDIFDKMFGLARDDVNASKAQLRSLPEGDWQQQEKQLSARISEVHKLIGDKDANLYESRTEHDVLRHQLGAHSTLVPVTPGQIEKQKSLVEALVTSTRSNRNTIEGLKNKLTKAASDIKTVTSVLQDNDLGELRRRLQAYRDLEASLDGLKHVHEKDASLLKQQERSLKILDEVPCGDQFPTCKFIKDAHKNKDKVEDQRDKVQRTLERLQKAEEALVELQKEDLPSRVSKLEYLVERKTAAEAQQSKDQIELYKLETKLVEDTARLASAEKMLVSLEEALQNKENAEVAALRHRMDELQARIVVLDQERISLAQEMGHKQSDLKKLESDREQRDELLQTMKAHELVMQAFSRKGVPSLIVASQLPLINAEVAKILHGIVDFNIEMEVDDGDALEVYINYGDSRRPIELGSGMEKMIASVAIRVALVNVSSLPRPNTFIIDEGFGALDDAMVEACNRLLVSLKRYFRSIIVITHVEGVKDIADHVIEITKVEKDSHVTAGNV